MSTSSKPPFVVVGTGRCGTVSITNILGSCPDTVVSHEEHMLHWYDQSDPLVGEIIRDAKSHSRRGITRGFVGFMYLPHIPTIRTAVHDLKLVYLWREKEATVKSMCRFMAKIRPSDKQHFVDTRTNVEDGEAADAKCFPVIDACSIRQAYEFYWEMYDKMVRDTLRNVFRIHTNELNNTAKLNELCDFLEIEGRSFPENRVYNATEDIYPEKPLVVPVDRRIRHEVGR